MKKKIRKDKDSIDWLGRGEIGNYTDCYSPQISGVVSEEYDLILKDTIIDNGELLIKDTILPLWRDLYETVFRLNPKSVFECGCGSCHHLVNMKTLLPGCETYGNELLQSQIDFGKEFFKLNEKLVNNIDVIDFSEVGAYKKYSRKFDFVYTNGVIEHLSFDKSVRFVKNMIEISNQYVFLNEGSDTHDYGDIIKEVRRGGYSVEILEEHNPPSSYHLLLKIT